RRTVPQGTRVHGQVTLDLCSHLFKTERLRTARIQVYFKAAHGTPTLVNEVVRYRPGGAAKAFAELTRVASHCPRDAVVGPVRGVGPARYRLKPLAPPVPGALALRVHETGRDRGKRVDQTFFIVYQIHGDVLSMVSGWRGGLAARQALTFSG